MLHTPADLSTFSPLHAFIQPDERDLILHFPDAHTICLNQQQAPPSFAEWKLECAESPNQNYYCFGYLASGQRLCLCPSANHLSDKSQQLQAQSLRGLLQTQTELGAICGLAMQLKLWRQTHQYCGQCGKPTDDHATERALYCPACDHLFFPRINPCIVVLVQKAQSILLAQSKVSHSGLFGLIAGFIEPGETAEQCVLRELAEEVNISVCNLQYHRSQSWPFSNALMLGFSADYSSGELCVDTTELLQADFFPAHRLPPHAASYSLSGQLIQQWLDKKLS